MQESSRRLVLAALALPLLWVLVEGHGRLIEPPSRGTMWRYGFSTPPDYNDHELYCGGFSRQWNKNGGKCGICGDPWDVPTPRAHEAGGKYGLGEVVRRYKHNTPITIRIELTANHRGHFEFRICPHNSPKTVGSQQCLDKHILRRAKPPSMTAAKESVEEQSHDTRYYPGPGNKIFEMRYQLPKDLTCSQCILQWRYIAGNNWGTCANGTGAVGCGPQEEFRACADVAIVDSEGTSDETPFINEIPDDEEAKKTADEEEVEERVEYWLLMLIMALSLTAVAVTLTLVYFYYYHGGERLKKWMNVERFRKKQQPPVPPPRTKKQPC